MQMQCRVYLKERADGSRMEGEKCKRETGKESGDQQTTQCGKFQKSKNQLARLDQNPEDPHTE